MGKKGRDDVEDAKLLIEQHTAYFGVYKDMDRELQNIEGEYNELTSKGMKSGPMGKKGKGKGKNFMDDFYGGKGGWDDGYSKGGKGKGKKGGKGYDAKGEKQHGNYDREWDDDDSSNKKPKKGAGKKGKGGKKGSDYYDDWNAVDDYYEETEEYWQEKPSDKKKDSKGGKGGDKKKSEKKDDR